MCKYLSRDNNIRFIWKRYKTSKNVAKMLVYQQPAMKTQVLFIILFLAMVAILRANAASSTTTEASETTTESPAAPQWSWTEFMRFFNSSGSGNKFYFFF
ncbi:uncharacterized protein Dsimw501_GD28440 [Drosophila simulans]|uniref:Uncharacterized protein n=2 Tax=Drosophila simulans TaxID=7240 RepID=A0A0J9RTF5_DROSI|nr:uncharacterized protein Dsimw501_GD28440 [Drosophila simulans]